MKPPLITYDTTFMFSGLIHGSAADMDDLRYLGERLKQAKRSVTEDWKTGNQGWLGCPDDTKLVKQIETVIKKTAGFDTCLVIGIGGSDLGARAAYHALKSKAAKRLEFLGANTDPDEIADVLKRVDLKKTVVNVISKSGDTVEPMSTFFVVREQLIKAVGQKKVPNHIVATTDEKAGSLHDLALREGYHMLPVPKNIGGRFSVLTAVGLYPLGFAGIRIKEMLAGAQDIRDKFLIQAPLKNAPTIHAALHVLGDVKYGQRMHVLMPYSSRLQEFGRWYRQLWAESLGKRLSRHDKEVFLGPTPIAALGATDQHSQVQLYAEGPKDKLFTFIEVEHFDEPLKVPADVKAFEPMAYLAKTPFSKMIHAERAATAYALAKAGRPSGTLGISKVTERTLGALFMFFEISVAIAGDLYQINTYDQPGVEAGKQAMYRLLGRPGFDPAGDIQPKNAILFS